MKVADLEVKVINYTPEPQKTVAAAARLCYSPVGAAKLKEELSATETEKLLNVILENGHYSTLEHISFTFAIEGISRVTSHQLVRHRIASYCLSEDTIVYTDHSNRNVSKRTIKELYNMDKQYIDMTHLRSVDEDNKILVNNKIKNVIKSGEKKLYLIETQDGYSIKATKEHKFLTEDGWKRLKDISEKDKIYTNGEPLYRDKEWLERQYKINNLSQKAISDLCGCSKSTIRKWVRKFNLQKEPGSWSKGKEPPNKGRTKDNYDPLKIVSEKMKGNTNGRYAYGNKHHSWKGDEITSSGGYARSNRIQQKIRKNKCVICGKKGDTEFHHKDKEPKNNKIHNLIELCITCHKAKHKGAVVRQIRLSKISNIEYKGKGMTYDIEMEEPHHNFIANGFVVHNSQQSQRYVRHKEAPVYILPERIYKLNAQDKYRKSFIKQIENCFFEYSKQVDYLMNEHNYTEKEAIEDARYILPNAAETKIVVTMNARTLLHFFEVRCCRRAQWEIRGMAKKMLKEVKKLAPLIFKKAGPACITEGECQESTMSCGYLNKGE